MAVLEHPCRAGLWLQGSGTEAGVAAEAAAQAAKEPHSRDEVGPVDRLVRTLRTDAHMLQTCTWSAADACWVVTMSAACLRATAASGIRNLTSPHVGVLM